MSSQRQQLDVYERWVAYLLVVLFLCLGFLSWRARKEAFSAHSVEEVYRERDAHHQKKEKKSVGKGLKGGRQKKRGSLLVKKETV